MNFDKINTIYEEYPVVIGIVDELRMRLVLFKQKVQKEKLEGREKPSKKLIQEILTIEEECHKYQTRLRELNTELKEIINATT